MKTLKWILLTAAIAVLTATAVAGSLGDSRANSSYLSIVQSELERSGTGLTAVSPDRKLLPVADTTLTKEALRLTEQFSVTDSGQHSVTVDLSVNAELYTAENVLDHMLVVTNTGNHVGYVRTWLAFEMGDLTGDEFEAAVLLNQNTAQWTWDEFTYGVQIGGERYAVICAKYNTALDGGATTEPNLLQILLRSGVANDISNRLDGNHDGRYEVHAYSQVVSDDGAWGKVTNEPWNKQPTE